MPSLLLVLLVAFGGTPEVRAAHAPAGAVVERLQCRVVAGAPSRRCTVTIPAGRTVRDCTPADAKAGHCGRRGTRKHAAWVVASNGAKCSISKKRTDWSREVVVTMKKKSATGAATCDLYVELAPR